MIKTNGTHNTSNGKALLDLDWVGNRVGKKSIFLNKKNLMFLILKKIDAFLELNLYVFSQYFQHGINFEDSSTYCKQ